MWSFIAVFFFDFFFARGAAEPRAGTLFGLVGFATIGMGAVGPVLAGTWADRLGRERITIRAMAVSAACALLIGWLADAPLPFVLR